MSFSLLFCLLIFYLSQFRAYCEAGTKKHTLSAQPKDIMHYADVFHRSRSASYNVSRSHGGRLFPLSLLEQSSGSQLGSQLIGTEQKQLEGTHPNQKVPALN